MVHDGQTISVQAGRGETDEMVLIAIAVAAQALATSQFPREPEAFHEYARKALEYIVEGSPPSLVMYVDDAQRMVHVSKASGSPFYELDTKLYGGKPLVLLNRASEVLVDFNPDMGRPEPAIIITLEPPNIVQG